MRVVFDTSSDWLLLEGVECESCRGNRYVSDESYTFIPSNQQITRNYGTIYEFKGTKVADKVCLLKESVCLNPFTWMQVTE